MSCISQELQRIYPELVVRQKSGMLGVNYIGLIPHLIKSIQEQQVEIEELKTSNPQIDDVYVQVFGHNLSAIKAYEKVGFQTIASKVAKSKAIENYLPSASKILMKLNLK